MAQDSNSWQEGRVEIIDRMIFTQARLPILARAVFGEGKSHFYINAGPAIGCNLAARSVAYGNIGGGYGKFETKYKKFGKDQRFNRFDAGLAGGVGGYIYLSQKGYLTLDLLYQQALTQASSASLTSKAFLLTLQVGYAWRLNKADTRAE